MASYVFPTELKSSSNTRPMIRFQCLDTTGDIIYLPVPEGLQFSDSATYNDTELGFLGGQISNGANILKNGGGLADLGKNALSNLPKDAGGILQAITANTGLSDEVKSAVGIATGTTLNKNITSEFTAVGTRGYSFSFQMIPKSKDEATEIKNIVKSFRLGLYPTGNQYQLKYPPKWKIQVVSQPNGSGDSSYLPKIFETTYMTAFSSTYNQGANLWYSDGSPLETTIALTFTETRALTREDVEKL
jgi:hypothetical protein